MCPSRCDQPPTGQLLSSKWRSESIALRRATGYQPFDKLRAGVQGRKGDKLLAESSDRPKQVTMDRIFDEGA